MPEKPGGGGHINENYDPKTGKYIKTNPASEAEQDNSFYKPSLNDSVNLKIDKLVSIPTFEKLLAKPLIEFEGAASVMPGTPKEDHNKGIDYFILDEEDNVIDNFDLKTVVSSIGEDTEDPELPIALNLYKTLPYRNAWGEGSHLNPFHRNQSLLFMLIDTFGDKDDLAEVVKGTEGALEALKIKGAKGHFVDKTTFDDFIQQNILDLNEVQDMIKKQQMNLSYPEEYADIFKDYPNTKVNIKDGFITSIVSKYNLDIAGEQRKVMLIASADRKGNGSIRLYIPQKIFTNTPLASNVYTFSGYDEDEEN